LWTRPEQKNIQACETGVIQDWLYMWVTRNLMWLNVLKGNFESSQCLPVVSQGNHAPWGLIPGFAGLTCFACQLCENMQLVLSPIRAPWSKCKYLDGTAAHSRSRILFPPTQAGYSNRHWEVCGPVRPLGCQFGPFRA